VFEKCCDASLHRRALVLGKSVPKSGKGLKLGSLVGRDRRSLRFGRHLRQRSERQEMIPLDRALVLLPSTEVVSSSESGDLGDVVVHTVFENGEVLDPLRSRAHERLTDVAETRGFRELARLAALERLDDDGDNRFDRLLDGIGRCRRHTRICFVLFHHIDHRGLLLHLGHNLNGPVFDYGLRCKSR
jgi:hypothetical protein